MWAWLESLPLLIWGRLDFAECVSRRVGRSFTEWLPGPCFRVRVARVGVEVFPVCNIKRCTMQTVLKAFKAKITETSVVVVGLMPGFL